MILYHSADLIWATRIKGAAEGAGLQARPVRNTDMLDARLGDSPARALVVDLDAPDVALALIRHLRAREAGSRLTVLAFGPHVAVEQFRAARAAGADACIARGGFSARLAQILTELDAGGRPGDDLHE
jgi:DNA-binding response OmpR family regulator